jgi:plastocyanin
MKKYLLFFILLFFITYAQSTVWIITAPNTSLSYSPNLITIALGDTVVFSIGSDHDAVEVTQASWNANSPTPVVGFQLPLGGGTVPQNFLTLGTHYYICTPHSSFAMKGRIVVTPTGIPNTLSSSENTLHVFPNPASEKNKTITLHISLKKRANMTIRVYDMTGKPVAELLSGTRPPGSYELVSDIAEKLLPGIYFIELQSSEAILAQKLVIE